MHHQLPCILLTAFADSSGATYACDLLAVPAAASRLHSVGSGSALGGGPAGDWHTSPAGCHGLLRLSTRSCVRAHQLPRLPKLNREMACGSGLPGLSHTGYPRQCGVQLQPAAGTPAHRPAADASVQ